MKRERLGSAAGAGVIRLQSVFEITNSLGEALAQLRELLRSEQQKRDRNDDKKVPRLEKIFNHA